MTAEPGRRGESVGSRHGPHRPQGSLRPLNPRPAPEAIGTSPNAMSTPRECHCTAVRSPLKTRAPQITITSAAITPIAVSIRHQQDPHPPHRTAPRRRSDPWPRLSAHLPRPGVRLAAPGMRRRPDVSRHRRGRLVALWRLADSDSGREEQAAPTTTRLTTNVNNLHTIVDGPSRRCRTTSGPRPVAQLARAVVVGRAHRHGDRHERRGVGRGRPRRMSRT